MENNDRRLDEEEDSSSDESDDDEMMMPGDCVRDPGRRRFPNQVFRERRRRRLLVIRRLKRRSGDNNNNSTSSSSEDTSSEDMEDLRRRPRPRARRCRRRRPRPPTRINSGSDFAAYPPEHGIEIHQGYNSQGWYHNHNSWPEIAFAILSAFVIVLFVETHIETFITGHPPHRFSCYLSGIVVCSALWCLAMMQDDFDGDLRDRDD